MRIFFNTRLLVNVSICGEEVCLGLGPRLVMISSFKKAINTSSSHTKHDVSSLAFNKCIILDRS